MGTANGKVVIVTGGAYGIGAATAMEFAREGAQVTIADKDEEAGNAQIERMKEEGLQGRLVLADLVNSTECRRVVGETVSAFGGVDILFNNVGIQPPEWYLNVEETSEEIWDQIMDVNLKSYFLMSKFSIPEIRKRGGGVIINTASVQGLQSMKGVPPYAASKGGILSLTRQMAMDYAEENIRVLAVCPGAIDTQMMRVAAANQGGDIEESIRQWGMTHPIGRIGTGQDIANVVVFLASDKASFMTGEYVCVDGGYMALGAWASIEP